MKPLRIVRDKRIEFFDQRKPRIVWARNDLFVIHGGDSVSTTMYIDIESPKTLKVTYLEDFQLKVQGFSVTNFRNRAMIMAGGTQELKIRINVRKSKYKQIATSKVYAREFSIKGKWH